MPSFGGYFGVPLFRLAVPCSATTVLVDDIRTTAAVQQRGRRHLPLLPEFKDVFVVDVPSAQVATVSNCVGQVLKYDLPVGSRTLRKGSRVLQTCEERGAGSVPLISPTRLPVAQWSQGERGFLNIGRRYRDRRGVLHPASFWQNPFWIRDCESRSEALSKFRAHLLTLPNFPQCLRALSGVRVVCHCQLDEACHGDILIEVFAAIFLRSSGCLQAKVGVFFTPQEHVDAASALVHPFAERATDDVTKLAVGNVLEQGPTRMHEHWENFSVAGGVELKNWNTMNVCFTKQWTDMLQRFGRGSVCYCSKSSSSNLGSEERKISSTQWQRALMLWET